MRNVPAIGLANVFIDSDIPPDIRDVLDTAAALDVTEFRVFELAFTGWFGRSALPEQLERYFVPYMFDGTVPPWVRQFTREVLRRQDRGELRRADFGLLLPQRTRGQILTGGGWAALLIIAFVLLLLGASSTSLLPVLKQCYFPPCY